MTTAPHEPAAGRPARLVIADDHAGIRQALARVLEDVHDIEVVAEAVDGVDAVDACRLEHPDVVLMDINMPRMDGLEATRRIRAEHPSTQVVILTSAPGPRSAEVSAAGAVSMVLKHEPLNAILGAVRAAADA